VDRHKTVDGNVRGLGIYDVFDTIEWATPSMNAHISIRVSQETSDASHVVVWGILHGIVIHKAIDLRREAAINSSNRETTEGCLDGGPGIPGNNRPSRH
jgi:hypothetical protein